MSPHTRLEPNRKKFQKYDDRQGNKTLALRFENPRDRNKNILRRYNSRMRIMEHYDVTHSILEHVSKNVLKGKNILHLAASTGVYAKFLQNECGAKAIALDIDTIALRDAKKRGVQSVIKATAVPHVEKREFVMDGKSCVLSNPKAVEHLPFSDKSMDYIVSENFLFSAFISGEDRGFEVGGGSSVRSEETLVELNRVLKNGGKLIITHAHSKDAPDVRDFVPGFQIYGFRVTEAFDENLKHIKNNQWPKHFVLEKVADFGN
ncbi:MAG: class I SAM-dependent methyltransferase [Candidatus Diapherotrites archaeon]